MEEPPDDDYYPVEADFSERAEEAYEAAEASVSQSGQAAPVQLQDTLTLANGQTISIGQLRGNVTATISINDVITASLIERTGKWKINNQTVETTVPSQYEYSLLEKKIPVVSAALSQIIGTAMTFSVSIQQAAEVKVQHEVPPIVERIADVFKGTIVTGA